MDTEIDGKLGANGGAPGASLAPMAVKGSFWIFALRITNRGLGLLRTIILARLLLPEHFGILGIVAVTISALETFTQPGLGTALVHKREEIEPYLDTAWTVSVFRCVLIFGLLYVIAPSMAFFFETLQAEVVLRVLAISVIIAGCRNIGVIYFQKELDFRKQYIYELSITLGNIVVAIPAAFLLRSVWALVVGGIAGSMVRFVMSYVLHPYRPRMRFEKEEFKDLFSFGKWVLGSSMLLFLVTQGDDIFMGKMFGVTALGFYQMAFMISNLPTTEISQVISHVTFPAYSKIQDDQQRFGAAYLKVLQVVLFIVIPLSGIIFTLSPELVCLVLSEKWLPVVPIIEVLVWAGLIKAIMDTTVPVFNAAGKPNIHTKWQMGNLLVLGISIYPLAMSLGVIGVSIAVLLGNMVASVGLIHEAHRVLRYDCLRFSKLTAFPMIGMFFSMGLVLCLKQIMWHNNIVALGVPVVCFVLTYVTVIYVFDKVFRYNMGSILRETIVSLRTTER